MKTLTIESANRKRNVYLLLMAIIFPLIYLPLMFTPLMNDRQVLLLFVCLLIPASAVLIFVVYKLTILSRKLKATPEIDRALRQEIFHVFQRKAVTAAFYTIMGVLVFLVPVSTIYKLPADLICKMLFFIGIMVYLISWLAYNRD